MARSTLSDLPLTYLGQVAEGRSVPLKWLHQQPGKTLLLSVAERRTTVTYVYHAPNSVSKASVQNWASTAFPFGCNIAVVSTTTINRRKAR